VILDIDHVGIAVSDLDAAVERYRRTLGVEPTHREQVLDQGVAEVLFAVGTSFIQLLGALGPERRSVPSSRSEARGYITSPIASMTSRPHYQRSGTRGSDRSMKSRDAVHVTR
jgi:catechol 2,3-dioxygenase-like lactoylglutathione lyase family enzyme